MEGLSKKCCGSGLNWWVVVVVVVSGYGVGTGVLRGEVGRWGVPIWEGLARVGSFDQGVVRV